MFVKTARIPYSESMWTLPPGLHEPRWYAVHCLSHRESGAAAQLCNQNFKVFLPRRRKTRRHARKLDTVLAPLFPGYLFVQLDLTREPWRAVNGTFGVAGLVMQGKFPAPLPSDVIASLLQNCSDDGIFTLKQNLIPGQPIRVLGGPFADFLGEMERLDGPSRVRVLLNILGRSTSVTVPSENVVRADSFI